MIASCSVTYAVAPFFKLIFHLHTQWQCVTFFDCPRSSLSSPRHVPLSVHSMQSPHLHPLSLIVVANRLAFLGHDTLKGAGGITSSKHRCFTDLRVQPQVLMIPNAILEIDNSDLHGFFYFISCALSAESLLARLRK